MNNVPINMIAAYKHGDALASVSGMLENVWERKTGVTKGRPWSIQNLMLKDATGTIKVTLFGRKECSSNMEGKQVELLNCLVDDNTYNGKTTRTVRVTEDSNVKTLDNAQPPPAPAAPGNNRGVLVHGQTVGMAINNSVTIILDQERPFDYYVGDDFIYDLGAIASSIIYVASALEAGQKLEAPQTGPKTTLGPESSLSAVRNVAGTEPPDDGNFLQEGEEAF